MSTRHHLETNPYELAPMFPICQKLVRLRPSGQMLWVVQPVPTPTIKHRPKCTLVPGSICLGRTSSLAIAICSSRPMVFGPLRTPWAYLSFCVSRPWKHSATLSLDNPFEPCHHVLLSDIRLHVVRIGHSAMQFDTHYWVNRIGSLLSSPPYFLGVMSPSFTKFVRPFSPVGQYRW